MREIKFRGRRAELPAGFVYGYFAIISGMNYIINDDRHHLIVAGTKQQYTGLKDKNGKEIYEGDIVKTYYRDNLPHTGEVYFQPTRLNWSVKHSAYTNQDLFVYTRPDCSFEVIGNIYENPELLNGG